MSFYSGVIEKKTGAPPDEDIRFLLELYCRGSIAMTVKWVLGGMKKRSPGRSPAGSSPRCRKSSRTFLPVWPFAEDGRVTFLRICHFTLRFLGFTIPSDSKKLHLAASISKKE